MGVFNRNDFFSLVNRFWFEAFLLYLNMAVLYFDTIGNKNPVVDKDTIIWFLKQKAAQQSKANRTKFWLNLLESYYNSLIKYEAYELLDFIKSQTTIVQKKNRAKWRIAQEKKSNEEIEHWRKFSDERKLRVDLIKNIGLN